MNRWRILCYHTVELAEQTAFARQIKFFLSRGYQPCLMDEGLRRVSGSGLPDAITISFDDADHTVVAHAQPVLDGLGIRAILYLTPDYVTQGSSYRDTPARPALTWDQLGHWLGAGHEIGSHTNTHVNLKHCSIEKRFEEMALSQEVIRRHLGINPVHVSYPWGQYDRSVREGLKSSGLFRSAATIDRGWNGTPTDPFRLRRDLIQPAWTPFQIRLRIDIGGWPPLYQLQRGVRRLVGRLRSDRAGQ